MKILKLFNWWVIVPIILGLALSHFVHADTTVVVGQTVASGGGPYTEQWGAGSDGCGGASSCEYTSAVLDTTLYNVAGYNNRNYGASSIGGVGSAADNEIYARGLLWFDFADQRQSGTVTVTAASIHLYITQSGGITSDYPVKVFAVLVDWGQSDSDNTASHECYEGDGTGTDPAADTTGYEPTWNNREDYGSTAWNTAGCDANTPGVDGEVSGDFDGSYDRSNALVIDAIESDFTTSQYATLTFNAHGLDVIEYMMNNSTHNYGFVLTVIDAEDTDTNDSFEYDPKEASGDNSPYISITYTTE